MLSKNKIKRIIIIFVVISIIIIKIFIFDKVVVKGNSMENTYKNNDVVCIKKNNNIINRFDVVIINEKGLFKGSLIKRVIALPNEKIQIKCGQVYINDKLLENDYGEKIIDSGIANEPIYLGDNQYFVLGDNRNKSQDSRSELIGLISKDEIIGKPIYRFLPLDRIGRVN